MRLKRVLIKGYKCLKETEIFFQQCCQDDLNFSAHLLVGINGSGKSCFLEALGLILTRMIQDEVPGFYFELDYQSSDGALIEVKPLPESERWFSHMSVKIDGKVVEEGRVPETYKPRRIVAYCSGVNHLMDSMLLGASRDSLAGDLFDAAKDLDRERASMEISQILNHYEKLDTDPRVLFLDANLSRIIVPLLFAVVPGYQKEESAREYDQLRAQLIGYTGKEITPVAFSISIDENRLQDSLNQYSRSPQYGRLEKLFRADAHSPDQQMADWLFHRSSYEQTEQEETIGSFCYQKLPYGNGYFHPKLSEEFQGDPMSLLSILLNGVRSNIIRNIQFSFKMKGCRELLGIEAFSDGELMWLARMGLVLMSRNSSSSNTVFLLDEPDIHFNDEWNMHFMSVLRKLSSLGQSGFSHEFMIATHSTLLLTDAYYEQVHLFSSDAEHQGVQVTSPTISAFAAQREEIAQKLFGADSIGEYSKKVVVDTLSQSQSPEEVYQLLEKTGPGYSRFQLLERYYELKKHRQ